MSHPWDEIEAGEESAPYLYEVTAEKIIGYSRAARYENLAYTSQAGAREMGLPGMIAPPAMVFVYAPVNLPGLAAVRDGSGDNGPAAHVGAVAKVTDVQFHGPLVSPGDVITSITKVEDRSTDGPDETLALRVSARNQRGELVAEYRQRYRWPVNRVKQPS